MEHCMASSDTTATIKDLQGDLKQLRNDVGKLAQQMTALLSGTGDEAIGQVKEHVRQMRENLEEAVTDAGKHGGEADADVSENCGEAIKESLRGHPFTTVALAVGLGFLFGAMWRR
jgi:ElaB/YqjD/DUF883 family membrane-anchored ribosome-binding protein